MLADVGGAVEAGVGEEDGLKRFADFDAEGGLALVGFEDAVGFVADAPGGMSEADGFERSEEGSADGLEALVDLLFALRQSTLMIY